MSTKTQYNPDHDLNAQLAAAHVSKIVYALITPETETVKNEMLGNDGSNSRYAYLNQFRDAWTSKQDQSHEAFFATWLEWAKPVAPISQEEFPFAYPTSGASEALRHLIYKYAADAGQGAYLHVFTGEYEGYKAIAEGIGLKVIEHNRDEWDKGDEYKESLLGSLGQGDLFFISQPSAIDGNVWHGFNDFIDRMPDNSVVADLTYVGAVPEKSVTEVFNVNAPSVAQIVFSLSKPFGVYYDRIGGVFCREEDAGLFGNKWFKNLTSLDLGTRLLKNSTVFQNPHKYRHYQEAACLRASGILGYEIMPSDVYMIGTGTTNMPDDLYRYIERAGRARLCLTMEMAQLIGTSGDLV